MTQTELLKMIGSGAVRDLDLTGRELKNIDFKGCRVENVTFDECTLTECNFDGCGMERVSFRKAVLRNCRFRRAKIAWSDFRYCEIERPLSKRPKSGSATFTAPCSPESSSCARLGSERRASTTPTSAKG